MPETCNDQLWDLVKCHDRYLLPYGGGGSGKSHEVAQKILLRIEKAVLHGYHEGFLCLRKTSPAVKASIFRLFKIYIDLWGLEGVKSNKTDLSYTWPGDQFISCGGLDDPEKVKSVERITGVWMEEATQFTLNDFRQLDLRLRGEDIVSYFQIIMSFNPMDDASWINDEFFDSEKAPKLESWSNGNSFRVMKTITIEELDKEIEMYATAIHSTWRDNKWVDDQYVAMLAALKDSDPEKYSIYDQGLWTALAQRIYVNYEEISEDQWPDTFDEVFYGLDFGYVSPTAMLMIGLKDGAVYEKEVIYEAELNNSDRIALMEWLGVDKNDEIFADPSEPELIDEIYDAGFNIHPANNSVVPGIDLVNRTRVKILTTSLNHLKEKRSYQRKVDKNGHTKEDPVKENDHLQDAERYALFSRFHKEDEPAIWLL